MRETQKIKLILKGLGKAQKNSNRRRYKCLLPSCNSDGIKSHSQQKRHQLESIAEDSKVIAIERDIYKSFSDNFNNEPSNMLYEKTIGEASRFIGYCNKHDTAIFSPIENGNLDINSSQHNLLLFLRCFSHEYANKRNAYDRSKDIYKECSDFFGVDGAEIYQDHINGMKLFLEIDAPYYLSKLFEAYENQDYSFITYNTFTLPKNLGVSSSTCISPLREEHPQWMFNNPNAVQPTVAFSIVPDKEKTSISFVWLKEFDSMCSSFLLVNEFTENLDAIINTYAINGSEDLCIRPSIWDSLPRDDKNILNWLMSQKDDVNDQFDFPQIIKI